jgi:hypothetical protein
MLDRRELLLAAFGLLGSVAVPRPGVAQPGNLFPLSNRLSLVTSGGNTLALSAAGGLVVVDSGAPDLSEALMESGRGLAPECLCQGKLTVPRT